MSLKEGAISVAAETAPREKTLTEGSFPSVILSQNQKHVNPGKSRSDQLRFLHRKAPAAEIVRTVQQISPRFGKVELSKAENDTYGIEIGERELHALWMKIDPDGYRKLKHRSDGHRLTKRLQCRVSEEFYRKIIDYCKHEGTTVNTMLLNMLVEYFGGAT